MFIQHLNKNKIYVLIFTIVILSAVVVFMNNNSFLYSNTVVKVLSSKDVSKLERTGTNGYTESVVVQELTGKVLNGHHKNEKVTFQNEYVKSGIITTEYRKGEQLFVSISDKTNGIKVNIIDKKRDLLLIVILGLFIIVLIFACGIKGLLTVIALIINTVTLELLIKYSSIGMFTRFIWIILCLIFIGVTLVFVGGISKKTLSSVFSSILTVTVIVGLYMITVKYSNVLKYETLNYALAFTPLSDIYMISVIFGSLGAIMDISVTINASAAEICLTQRVTVHQLSMSLKEIEQDIMGTMVNVLFFSYISSSLPLIIMRMCHNYSWSLIFRYDFSFELIRFLIGSIGIIMAIPISHLISLYFNRKVLM